VPTLCLRCVWPGLSANSATTEAADRGNAQANREADYMCFSPLRRKTSDIEGEEEYTTRLVSRNLRDRRQN
jgi:hypothetical protein